MKNNPVTDFRVDKESNTIRIKREFLAPKPHVWAAWTEPELLDQWWAPKPYQLKTKIMDFNVGGQWLYAMISPEDEKHWCKATYKAIDPQDSFSYIDSFCDENGKENTVKPNSLWTVTFSENEGSTTVNIALEHEQLADVEKMIDLGFKEGFAMAVENLDELLSKLNT